MINIKQKAINLRRKGYTFTEIEKTLGIIIPKSTLSGWCKEITLTSKQKDRIIKLNLAKLHIAQQKSVISSQKRNRAFLDLLRFRNQYLLKRLDIDTQRIILSIIYICEGAKWKSHRGIMFGNSDPKMIRFFIFLLMHCFPKINLNDLRCRVSYRADQDIKALENYWAKITGISLNHFFKTKPDPRTIGRTTKKPDYKGVCVVTCRGTDIQLELETIAKLLFEYTGPVA